MIHCIYLLNLFILAIFYLFLLQLIKFFINGFLNSMFKVGLRIIYLLEKKITRQQFEQ